MSEQKKITLKRASLKALKGLFKATPMILGTILLASIVSVMVPKSFYIGLFSKNAFVDSIIGSVVGSISAGNPMTSYIFGGEMLKQGVGLIAVTAFLVCWVTVGVIQYPAEAAMLGKRFAFLRNITSFLLSMMVALVTVSIYEAIVM